MLSAKDLLLIIKRPGWTTPAELALVSVSLDMALAQTKLLQGFMGDLKAGAGKVGG